MFPGDGSNTACDWTVFGRDWVNPDGRDLGDPFRSSFAPLLHHRVWRVLRSMSGSGDRDAPVYGSEYMGKVTHFRLVSCTGWPT